MLCCIPPRCSTSLELRLISVTYADRLHLLQHLCLLWMALLLLLLLLLQGKVLLPGYASCLPCWTTPLCCRARL
jgi:hypothetical protein